MSCLINASSLGNAITIVNNKARCWLFHPFIAIFLNYFIYVNIVGKNDAVRKMKNRVFKTKFNITL